MPTESTLEKFKDQLFDDIANIDCTPSERRRILIYRYLFTTKLERPYITNSELSQLLSDNFSVSSVSQSYRYIGHIEILLCNVRSSEKQWIRYIVVETLKEALQLAKDSGDIKAMVAAADKLGKYTRLDQDDPESIPWEKIEPRPIEYVNDPTVLGLPAVANPREFIEKVKRRYTDQDVKYIEIPDERK